MSTGRLSRLAKAMHEGCLLLGLQTLPTPLHMIKMLNGIRDEREEEAKKIHDCIVSELAKQEALAVVV